MSDGSTTAAAQAAPADTSLLSKAAATAEQAQAKPEAKPGTADQSNEQPEAKPTLNEGRPPTEGKPQQAAEQVAVALESLQLPDGQVWDEKIGGDFLELINNGELGRQELAQKLVDMFQAISGSASSLFDAEIERANNEMRQKWMEESLKDKEFGGDKWGTAQAAIARGRDHLATAGAVDILNDSGLCNHPEILRMFYKAGKLLSEDTTDGTRPNTAALKSDEEIFYSKKN